MRTKQNSKRIRTLRRGRLALALVAAMAAPVAMAQDLPTGATVASGAATINTSGNDMTISQSTQGAIINWGTFDINTGFSVTFAQPNASSVTLNRVVGPGISFIDGMLNSNGNVFIINTAGIAFSSGAQVNVGGLVASTLDITDGDFLTGVSSGQYRFAASGSLAGAIWNDGQLTAADGGTIGLIGSQINNAGNISTTNGSVVFGATSQVTLDYFGDGLTQVTVSGNGLGVSNCSLDCNGGITSSGNVYAYGGHIEMRSNTMDGQSAGNGLFVDPANGGRIWIAGTVDARTSGSRRGSVIIDAGMGNIDLGGGLSGQVGNVSAVAANADEQAGTIFIQGNQLFTHLCTWTGGACVNNNQLGLVNASAYGTGGSAGEIHIDVNRLYHGGVLQASANDGSGGLIDISADNAEIYNRVFAYGNNGTGGTINIDANSLLLFRGQQPWLGGPGTAFWSASLLAYGTTTAGSVNINAGSLVVTDLGNVTPEFTDLIPVINATGQLGGDGGAININASYLSIDTAVFADVSGEGQGGSIDIMADTFLLDGGLVSMGGTNGGTVTTTTMGSLFAGANAYVQAETWLVHAPSIEIMPTSGALPGSGAVLSDDALSASLDGGTIVQLYADAGIVSGATGNIYIGSGVNILHTTGDAAGLDMRATAGIYGSYFNIESTGGPLDLSFKANANGGDPNAGYVSFLYGNLASNGGDVFMSGDGRGVYLEYSQVSSGAGDIFISGDGDDNGVLLVHTSLTSTGGDISINASSVYGAAVRLEYADIGSGGGDIAINGDGPDGVWVVYSDVASAGGNIVVQGTGIYSGSYFHDSTFDSAAGNIDIFGTASLDAAGYYPFGVALAGSTLISTTGDISVVGDAIGGSGIEFWTSGSLAPGITTGSGTIALTSTGANGLGLEGLGITTDTGDITIFGSATSASSTAGVFVGSSGLTTNGGDISITGTTAGGTGVWLYYGDLTSNGGDITVLGEGGYYGVQVWDGLVSSGTGAIAVTGTATGSGSNATGVNVRDASFDNTSGGITIDGSAAQGKGVFFGSTGYGPGSSVTTTSGAIAVISTGLSGLNVANVPFSTVTGDITLEGHALGSGFGLYIGSGGLVSNGGDITLIGSSVDTTGVLVYNENIASNGGVITIYGSSTNAAGAQVSGSDIDSAGGNIAIHGEGPTSTGLIVAGANITSGAGDLSLSGTGGGFGAGVSIGQGSSISTTSGDVSIDGTSSTYIGVLLNLGDVTTATGNIDIAGAGGTVGVRLSSGGLTTTSGDINIAGMGGNDAGLRFGADTTVDAGSGVVALAASNDGSYDAIILQGSIASTTGVNLRPLNEADTILLGAGNGFSVSSADLATINSPLLVIGSAEHAGAIRVTEAVDWDGNLTLQNQGGGSGGIDIQAAVDVGDNILALASGGNISQTSAGGITAHSLLAIAGGDVALTTAQNNVAASSVAGSAGGDFAYEDVDSLAIGEVSSSGYSPIDGGSLISLSAVGIAAEGNVLVRTATGDLTLGADVSGSSIALVAAGVFLNPTGATLSASNGWRIYASTPDGEERGGLQGDGQFDVFGCAFGDEACTGLGSGNQFIYQERRLVQAPIAPETVAELFDEDDPEGAANELLQAAICPVADAGDLLQAGASKDVLAQEWLKTRHRLRLSNCIDNKNAPGCRF